MEVMTPTDKTLPERFDAIDRRFDETDRRIELVRSESSATREEVVTVKEDMQGIKREFGHMRESIDALHMMIHRGSQGVIITMIGVIVTLLIKL